MSLVAQKFRETVSKSKDYSMKVETEANIGYSTGFLTYDFKNGLLVQGKRPTGEACPYYSIGITDGSLVMIIGRSGCGKTTWAVQAAANIIRPFKTSCILHDDIEAGIVASRKSILTGLVGDDLQERYIHRNTGITAENFYERVKMLHDIKVNDRENFVYDTGLFNEVGERIFKLEPSVYILDSLAMLMPGKYTDEDELAGQMSATAAAKTNAAIFKRIIPMLKSANIILMVINHINQKVEINPMQKSPLQLSYLKQGETLPGGNAPIYLSNLMIRFDDVEKLDPEKEFGIAGSIVRLTLVKSRSNASGRTAKLVFDQFNGYDQDLSLLILLKEHKLINGAGAYLYIGDRSDIKFSQKQFKDKLRENPELRQILLETALPILKGFVNYSDDTQENVQSDVTSMILSELNLVA